MMKTLKIIEEEFSVCQVADYGKVDFSAPYVFIGSTEDEKSLVCPVRSVPENTVAREDGWRAFRFDGTLAFSLIGILAMSRKSWQTEESASLPYRLSTQITS